jgi:thiosulfate/3-mercaptopyruvate sulfurtransferase
VRTGYANPRLLVDSDWLERHMNDPDLRIIDCNVRMTPKAEGGYAIDKGLFDWQAAHIPNSCFIDLVDELAAPHGIGNAHRVALYSRGANYWATRLFLMFRAMGHGKVQVLNGGWDKWVAEHRPVTIAAPRWPAASFKAKPKAGQIIGKDDVRAALGRKDTRIINALAPDVHSGAKVPYARPGHIAGSVNVYAMDLIDPKTKTFLPAAELRKKFAPVKAMKAKRVITYCGGGISATTDSFALMLLGHKNVALYDGSMTEWAADPTLPMETGPMETES